MIFDLELIKHIYQYYPEKMKKIRANITTPLTLTEKILYAHLAEGETLKHYQRGQDYVNFAPDRVAMQDATAQMALLQLMNSGRQRVAVPSTVHCDHLIQAYKNAHDDLIIAENSNQEVYQFLRDVSNKYGIGFWKPDAGIIHQVLLENYAFPGGMMIGTDSHTPNAGGLSMIAIGVGGADAVDVMAGMPWELKMPKIIGVKLMGKLSGWASSKDVILKLAGILTVKGATNAVIEYFGSGTESLSATGKATICNMGAEVGATTSIFPYSKKSSDYLVMTGRKDVVELAASLISMFNPDPEVLAQPEKYYDEVIEIDLTQLEPYINGPFTPDLAYPISEMAKAVKENGYPDKIEVGLIGSCTNSSYEDIMWGYELAEREFSHQIFTMKQFDALKKAQGEKIAKEALQRAKSSGKLIVNDVICDAFLQNTLLKPEDYSVIATLNLNGDYVSDQLAAMVGGIGIAPGANINYMTGHAIFEATHGTAPDIAGNDQANPSSLLLSGVMMFDYLGWTNVGKRITDAMQHLFQEGYATVDLAKFMNKGQPLSTSQFMQAMLDNL